MSLNVRPTLKALIKKYKDVLMPNNIARKECQLQHNYHKKARVKQIDVKWIPKLKTNFLTSKAYEYLKIYSVFKNK